MARRIRRRRRRSSRRGQADEQHNMLNTPTPAEQTQTIQRALANPSIATIKPAIGALQSTLGNQYVQRLIADVQREGWTSATPTKSGGKGNVKMGEKPIPKPGDPGFIGPLTEEQMKNAIIKRIKKNYNVDLDNLAGIQATNKRYFRKEDEAKKNKPKLKGQDWTLPELEALEDVLKKYAPILGQRRATSTLAGTEQGLTSMSRINVGLDFDQYKGAKWIDDQIKNGWTLQELRDIADMTVLQVLFSDNITFAIQNAVRANLANYDARQLAFPSGWAGYYTREDPGTLGETFRKDKNVALYNSFVTNEDRFPGDIPKTMRQTIAHELSHALIEEHQLGHFTGKFSDYWSDQNTRKSGDSKVAPENVEAPITYYGGTNAAEDLAETAGYFFVDPSVLEKGNPSQNPKLKKGQPGNPAPRRKEYMERVVAEWTSDKIKSFGEKSDRLLNLAFGSDRATVQTLYDAAQEAYKSLSTDDRKKVEKQKQEMDQVYMALIKAAPTTWQSAKPSGTKGTNGGNGNKK